MGVEVSQLKMCVWVCVRAAGVCVCKCVTTGKPWGTRLPVCDTSTSCKKSNKEQRQLERALAMLRNVGRRLILYLVLTDALVPEPLVEDLVFEGPRAAHHALLDVGDGGGVLHNLDHSCNVATNLPSAIHPKLNGTPPSASGPPGEAADLFCCRWRCSHTAAGRDPGIPSPRWTP